MLSNDPTPPALSDPSLASTMNDQLSTAISAHPDRFRGFCFLPMGLPSLAAAELDRCITDLHFVGALIDSHLPNMTFYGSEAYDPFWETAQRLNVPIYLHPTYAPVTDVTGSEGRETPSPRESNSSSYNEIVAAVLSAPGFGWHVDNGLSFLRLWLGGVFDRYPDVKLVLGHMGETIPFMLDRVDSAMGALKSEGVSVKEAWARNVWITTSGFFSMAPFRALKETTDVERILVSRGFENLVEVKWIVLMRFEMQFSVDYPWSTNEVGVAFMQELKDSGVVSKEEWEMIAFKNAQTLLKL